MYRKSILTFLSVMAMISCQKDPDTKALDNEYLVYTRYDESFSSGGHHTYCITDSILVINYSGEEEYMHNSISDAIIAAYVPNMNDFGYERVAEKKKADLGIQVSYISDTKLMLRGIDRSFAQSHYLKIN